MELSRVKEEYEPSASFVQNQLPSSSGVNLYVNNLQNTSFSDKNSFGSDLTLQNFTAQQMEYEINAMCSTSATPEMDEEFQNLAAIMETASTSLPGPSTDRESPRDIFSEVKEEPFDEQFLNMEDKEIDLAKVLPSTSGFQYNGDVSQFTPKKVKYEPLDEPLLNPNDKDVVLSDCSDEVKKEACDSGDQEDPGDEDYTPKDAESSDKKSSSKKKPKKQHQCGVCNKFFENPSRLKEHYRTHTGEMTYKCNLCPKKYAHNNNLVKHMRIHSGEKPYVCKQCGQCFSQPGVLKYHIRTHTGEKPIKCDFCEKRFRIKSHLNDHMRTHTGEKPFACNDCPARFTKSCSLKKHRSLRHV